MSLIINHNMMAMNAARNLGTIYNRLATSVQRLSSGLRINGAGDDAAGLAIRELMRADIAVIGQGIRNASDGISMIQTAEGAMAVIDEKLTRMRELAEQASTGTYTTAQRQIMNSEYQQMAAEIDRIANATDFNQTKLLDGSLSNFHDGRGMKLHFGTGNSDAEDYYFVTIGDVRATTTTGLQVGGGGVADIWRNETAYSSPNSAVISHDTLSAFTALWFNNTADEDLTATANPSNLVGIYRASSGDSLQDLIETINQGTAARVQLDFATNSGAVIVGDSAAGSEQRLLVGNTNIVFYFTSTQNAYTSGNVYVNTSGVTDMAAAITSALNHYTSANIFAVSVDSNTVLLFAKTAGVSGNSLTYQEVGGNNTDYYFSDLQADTSGAVGYFSMGGLNWISADYEQRVDGYHLTVEGNGRRPYHDIEILDISSFLTGEDNWAATLNNFGSAAGDWSEVQDASGRTWAGADILTQSAAQEALEALDGAMIRKDIVRANLGAIQNRLENTITQLSIQSENLQASESRISDVDVAAEMTEFTRNNILSQAATSMLAQANSLAQLALNLLQ